MIGSLGAFVSGSHTVSNVMFYGLQVEAAEFLGLPVVLVLIGQTSGASIGNMVAIHNAVSISATTGATGSEGKMIAAAFLPFVICLLAVAAVLFLYLALGVNWVA
jgi:lactate permease